MKRRRRFRVLVASIVLGVGALGIGAADAQPGGGAVGLSTQRNVQLSGQQMLAQAQEQVAAIGRAVAATKQQLQQARQARDVVKVLCLNDKVNQMDVANRSAKDRVQALRSAVERNDSERAQHEYTVMGVLSDRVRTLMSEASQCIGEETGFVGESAVSVDIDPSLPDTDPSFSPEDPFAPTQAGDTAESGPDSISPPPVVSTGVD